MELSKHNIFSKLADSDSWFIVNPLSGNADILSAEEAAAFQNNAVNKQDEYISKGYIVNPEEENKRFRQAYLDFIDERDKDEVQLFFVPWYSCNFSCSYCFQDEYSHPADKISTSIIDAFFFYIKKHFSGRRKYVTIFGGEPLLSSPFHMEMVEYFLQKATSSGLDVAIVTNGYHLEEYIEVIEGARIREIQVTLDGTRNIHDARRTLKGGSGSFDKITRGIDLLLERNIPVNLRVVVDKENISELPALAKFAIERKWTTSPFFKTGLGRNYELHHCQAAPSKLFGRLEMYQEIYRLIRNHPEILEFHRPAFSISNFIFEHGELPNPLFDSCSGTKTEWAFDYTGKIYACTATVGNSGDDLGSFYPEESLKTNEIEQWEERDVVSMKECSNCNVRLACGGGCAAVARSKTGKLDSPDCRPVKGLLALGISLYNDFPDRA